MRSVYRKFDQGGCSFDVYLACGCFIVSTDAYGPSGSNKIKIAGAGSTLLKAVQDMESINPTKIRWQSQDICKLESEMVRAFSVPEPESDE